MNHLKEFAGFFTLVLITFLILRLFAGEVGDIITVHVGIALIIGFNWLSMRRLERKMKR